MTKTDLRSIFVLEHQKVERLAHWRGDDGQEQSGITGHGRAGTAWEWCTHAGGAGATAGGADVVERDGPEHQLGLVAEEPSGDETSLGGAEWTALQVDAQVVVQQLELTGKRRRRYRLIVLRCREQKHRI